MQYINDYKINSKLSTKDWWVEITDSETKSITRYSYEDFEKQVGSENFKEVKGITKFQNPLEPTRGIFCIDSENYTKWLQKIPDNANYEQYGDITIPELGIAIYNNHIVRQIWGTAERYMMTTIMPLSISNWYDMRIVAGDTLRVEYSSDHKKWYTVFEWVYHSKLLITNKIAEIWRERKFADDEESYVDNKLQTYSLYWAQSNLFSIDLICKDFFVENCKIISYSAYSAFLIVDINRGKNTEIERLLLYTGIKKYVGSCYWNDIIEETSYTPADFEAPYKEPEINVLGKIRDGVSFDEFNASLKYILVTKEDSDYIYKIKYTATNFSIIREPRYYRRYNADGVLQIWDSKSNTYVDSADKYIHKEVNDNLMGVSGLSDYKFYDAIGKLGAKYLSRTQLLADAFNGYNNTIPMVYKSEVLKKIPGTNIPVYCCISDGRLKFSIGNVTIISSSTADCLHDAEDKDIPVYLSRVCSNNSEYSLGYGSIIDNTMWFVPLDDINLDMQIFSKFNSRSES